MAKRYRKKPVEVEARWVPEASWDGDRRAEVERIAEWCGGTAGSVTPCVLISTLEGTMVASPGDWIIRGVKGEFYPCKPDIFEAIYEEVLIEVTVDGRRGAINAAVLGDAALPAEGDETISTAWDGAPGSEECQECRKYNGVLWHAPGPLWTELMSRYGGLICPRCFDAKARAVGIRLTWTPVVHSREGVATTNWWNDPIRDRLLMGEPDPGYHENEKACVPQGHWGEIARALGWAYETPYPEENRMDRMPGVVYRDAGVNAEAEACAALHPEATDG